MTSPPRIAHAAATDIGLARDANEDVYLTAPPLFAVADGMGGHRAGDVAAQTAVEVLAREVARNEALPSAVKAANKEVYRLASANPNQRGMGTTITAMIAAEGSAQIVHVGDSRAYLMRDGDLQRITQDHSVVGRMVREGRLRPEDADHHPQRSVIERAVGVDPDVEVDAHTVAIGPGDRILLCTDGLTGSLSEEEIRDILQEEREATKASKRLVEKAVTSGATDNVTVVVVDYPEGKEASPARQRTFRPTRGMIAAAVALVVLAAAALGGRAAALNSWYVGAEAGKVVIFRGLPGSFGGIRINKVAERTDLDVASLPTPSRRDLERGIPAEDGTEAELIVENLRGLSTDTPAAASVTPAPGGAAP